MPFEQRLPTFKSFTYYLLIKVKRRTGERERQADTFFQDNNLESFGFNVQTARLTVYQKTFNLLQQLILFEIDNRDIFFGVLGLILEE